MKLAIVAALCLLAASSAAANDWQKFYRPVPQPVPALPWSGDPQVLPAGTDAADQRRQMWVDGYTLIGFSTFNSSNSKTADAVRLAKNLHARFAVIATELSSSSQSAIPITTPTSTTSYTDGTITGVGGSVGYNGTTTTFGNKTTYIPITVNRFNKLAVFYAPAPKQGIGILSRPLNPAETAHFETQKGVVVEAVRAGSPAYAADMLPGDVVLTVNGVAPEAAAVAAAFASGKPIAFGVSRASRLRTVIVTVPASWHD